MADLVRVDGRPVIDYMARDYQSLLAAMRDRIPLLVPEWTDFTNEADFGNVLLELFAHIGDILSYYQDRVANESFLPTARTRRSVLAHLRLIGYELGTAAPAATTLTVTVGADHDEVVTINKGDAFATRSQPGRPSVRFEYTRDAPLVIDFAAVPVQQPAGVKVFGPGQGGGIPVEEGRLIRDEQLGTSDGTHNQRFPLARPGVLLDRQGTGGVPTPDVVVTTVLAGVVDVWTRHESLAFSQAGQLDYVLEVDADDRATVIFGDGAFGAIPKAGATVHAIYRVGGGVAGNVPAGAVDTIAGAPALAGLAATVTNTTPATGGADREDIDHAVRQAPSVFRSLRRAVTAADYEALALSFPGVGKVRAVADGWNRVTLFVAPEHGGNVSDVLEAGLLAYFEDKRMVTQIIEVSDVDYVPVMVTATVSVRSFFVRADVLDQVRQTAAALLAFDNVDFNQTVYLSRFYEEIQNVPGVAFLNITEFRRADQPAPLVEPHGTIVMGPNEVPVIPLDPAYQTGLRILDQDGRPA